MACNRPYELFHRLAVGSLLGALAYVVNYAGVWLLLGIDGATWKETYSHVLVSDPNLKFTGQILYNAQFVGTRYDGDGGSVSVTNELTDASLQENITSTIPEIGYYIIPILVLVIVGYVLYRYEDPQPSRVAAAKIGVSVIPGYLLLSVVGVFLFVLHGGFVISRPDPPGAILLTGIVYPGLWGGAGAVIGHEQYSG